MPQKHTTQKSIRNWSFFCLAGLAVILAAILLLLFFTKQQKQPDSGQASPVSQQTAPPSTVPADGRNEDELILAADKLSAGYFYEEAIASLEGCTGERAKAKLAEYEGLKAALVPYTDRYYHIFFHSLILDTGLAFDNKGNSANGYNMWMTTQSEFKKMLPLLLENNFVLYDITQMAEVDENGNVSRKAIYLPEGKKPLVISVDDVDYYDYMHPDGFADRLDVDENGRVVTIVKDTSGNESVTYDGDVMPILDSFVEEHPEFSFRGAKGIVATTGYAGAFGYRITDLEQYSEEEGKQMLAKVEAVAKALRKAGWQIASHSYTHNQYWNTLSITMNQMTYDTEKWKNTIEPYVGNTNIFISPFGVTFDENDQRFQHLLKTGGFSIYCPVTASMKTSFKGNVMIQERMNLDGYTMIKHPERVSQYFFDPALVLDSSRPPMP